MLLSSFALAASVDLGDRLDHDLVAPAGGDAWCLPALAEKGRLPVGLAGGQLRLTWTGAGASALVELVYADGVRRSVRVASEAELGAPGGPSERALPVLLGSSAKGTPVMGSEWVLPTGRPDVAIQELVLTRQGGRPVCVTAVAVEAEDPGVATDTRGWYAWPVGSLPDQPWPLGLPVEAPAGRRGALGQAADGSLRWADGSRARFWGVNLYTRNALPPKELADRYAAGLAAMGVNLVRMHHIDLDRGVLLNPRRGEPGQPTFDEAALDRLDFFVSRLFAHGVHLFLEFATQRRLTAADGAGGPGGAPDGHKLLPMFLPDWEAAYLAHARGVWGRVNPYTGRSYAEDPGVVVVELSNEHSLLASWGGGIESLPTEHRARLEARFTSWLAGRYADDAALAAAWSCDCNHPGLVEGESLAGRVGLDPAAASLVRSWPARRREDLLSFYAELEQGFYRRLSAEARKMGFQQPLSPTLAFGRLDLAVLHDSAQIDDFHLEWDAPLGGEQLRNLSLLANPWAERSIENAVATLEGRAVSFSELNHPSPNRFAAEAPLTWATLASIQDWDILVWNDLSLLEGPPSAEWIYSPYDLAIQPLKLAQFAAASSAFRGGWIPGAPGYAPLSWTEAAVVEQREARWSTPAVASRVASFLGHRIRSVVGRVEATRAGTAPAGVGWWTDPGLLVLDLPKLRARVGPPAESVRDGAGPSAVPGLQVESRQWAAVSLASADGADLGEARRALLAVATRHELTGQRWAEAGTRLLVVGTPPARIEPFVGRIRFAFGGRPTVTPLDAEGGRMAPLAVKSVRGLWELQLAGDVASPLLLVER